MTKKYEDPQAHKKRRGLLRIWYAYIYSLHGLIGIWRESPAFRLELILTVLILPTSFFIGSNWIEMTLLVAVLIAVLIVEIINTAIEVVIDRISLEWHPLSKLAKDLGSSAVFLSLLFCAFVWISAILKIATV